jgi:hypothetical protein
MVVLIIPIHPVFPDPIHYLRLFLRIDDPKETDPHKGHQQQIQSHSNKRPSAHQHGIGESIAPPNSREIDKQEQYLLPMQCAVASEPDGVFQGVPVARIHEPEGDEEADEDAGEDEQGLPEGLEDLAGGRGGGAGPLDVGVGEVEG